MLKKINSIKKFNEFMSTASLVYLIFLFIVTLFLARFLVILLLQSLEARLPAEALPPRFEFEGLELE